jgi:hypothetical protein
LLVQPYRSGKKFDQFHLSVHCSVDMLFVLGRKFGGPL